MSVNCHGFTLPAAITFANGWRESLIFSLFDSQAIPSLIDLSSSVVTRSFITLGMSCPNLSSDALFLASIYAADVISTPFSSHFIESPRPGIGVYFGRLAPSSPIFFPIASNGSTAFQTALLTFFAAINATQMNIRAMISIIIVPSRPPRALSQFFQSSAERIPVHLSCASPAKLKLNHQIVTLVLVICLLSGRSSIVVTILLSGIPKSGSVQVFPVHHLWRDPPVGAMIAVMTTRPNESASPTTAGTKQSPINSLILKSSS